MALDPLFWALQGPRAFLGRVAAALDRSRTVAVVIPLGAPPKVLAQVHHHLRDRSEFGAHYVQVVGNESVAHAMQGFIDPTDPVPEWRLRQRHDLSHDVIVLEGDSEEAKMRILEYAVRYLHLAEREGDLGPALVFAAPQARVLDDGNARLPLGVLPVSWHAAVVPSDMDIYVAYRCQGRAKPGEPALVAAFVREFAGLDPLLAERLMELHDAEVLDPVKPMRKMAEEMSWLWRHPNWANGAYMRSGGREPSPLLLVLQDARARLATLSWRAQVQAVMPWMELHRREVIEPHRQWIAQLPQPIINAAGRPYDVSDLNYSDVANIGERHAWRGGEEDLQFFSLARKVRNHLAHQKVAPMEEVLGVIAGVSRRIRMS